MIIDISIAVIALAFVVFVIYLIFVMKALRVTLGQVNQTLVETRKQLGEVGLQAQKVMEHTNQISFDLKQKVEAFNPIINAVNQAGQILERQATTLKKDFLASTYAEENESNLDAEEYFEKKKRSSGKRFMTIAAALELAGIGINLWQKLKKRR